MDFESSRLDKVIRRLYGKNIPQSVIEKAIRNKDIMVNGQKASANMRIFETDNIYVHDSLKQYTNNSRNHNLVPNNMFQKLIIYEDQNIIAINKPSGLAVQLGTKTELAVDIMAKAYNPEARLLHRIDKHTSGIVILSKNLKTSRYILHMFKNNNIHKKYTAIVSNNKSLKNDFSVNAPLLKLNEKVVVDKENGKAAKTTFKLIKLLPNNLALINAFPLTGRTHQIRVHLQYIGCPILGDEKYNGRCYKKLCLHASALWFLTIDNKKITINAPLPSHISELL